MSANYKLSKNHLTEDDENYRALVEHVETLTQEDILDEIEWHSSSLTRADMISFNQTCDSAIIRALLKGKSVSTDLVIFKLSIRGTFNGSNDQFDPSRHRLVITVSPGVALRHVSLKDIQLEKQRSLKRQPSLDIYLNMHNGDSTMLSPTHTARILGDQLRFDPADPEQGLFLIPQATGSNPLPNPAPIRVEEISRMTPGEIIFRVPDNLAAGEYKLEVRTQFGKSGIRTGMFEEILSVA